MNVMDINKTGVQVKWSHFHDLAIVLTLILLLAIKTCNLWSPNDYYSWKLVVTPCCFFSDLNFEFEEQISTTKEVTSLRALGINWSLGIYK